jgi:uncharacterized protein involved in exopolysaccharide biosynthesis
MMPESIDRYLQELRQALSERGRGDQRIVDEAREHLVDAVQDGLRRGLDRVDAEREAMERFGPPDVIAARALEPRSRIMSRLTAALDTIVGHWRWITAATAIAALVTSVASYRLLPVRYRSETVIAIVPNWLSPEQAGTSQARLHSISQEILSTSRLDWVARDFGLDKLAKPPGDAIHQMRSNISVEIVGSDRPEQLRVSYQSPDPQLAKQIAERIATLFVGENLRLRERLDEGALQSLDAEIDETRLRLAELERTLDTLKATPGNRVLRADLIPFEVLQERYKGLLERREHARSAASMERRAIGDQFRVLEPARVPDRPVGPSRASVNVFGALTGLMLSTVALVWRKAA